jgi:hypothetical protein
MQRNFTRSLATHDRNQSKAAVAGSVGAGPDPKNRKPQSETGDRSPFFEQKGDQLGHDLRIFGNASVQPDLLGLTVERLEPAVHPQRLEQQVEAQQEARRR